MSEFDELVLKLKEQQRKLISIIGEAEAKIIEYNKAIKSGKEHLQRVEAALKTLK